MFSKIVQIVKKLQLWIGIFFLVLFFLIVLYQIFTRLLSISVIWTDEASTYAFIWAVFMGAAVMVSENAHFTFGGMASVLKGRSLAVCYLVIDLIMLAISIAILIYGINSTRTFWKFTWTSIPSFSRGWVWLSMPVTGFTMCLYKIEHILQHLKMLRAEDTKRGESAV